MNHSKCYRSWLLALFLLRAAHSFGTTAVFIIQPQRITVGTDRLGTHVDFATKKTAHSTLTKSFLVRHRFIVTSIGLEDYRTGDGRLLYSFPAWIKHIEAQVNSQTSLVQLADIIEKESSLTFATDFPVGKLMQLGAIERSDASDRFLVQFLVAGFNKHIPTLIQINYEFDWKGKCLIGPTREIEFPKNGLNAPLIYTSGRASGIQSIAAVDSYASKRLAIMAPEILRKMLDRQELTGKEAILVARILIGIEAEIEPTYVGNGATIIEVPLTGRTFTTEFDGYPDPPEGNLEKRKIK